MDPFWIEDRDLKRGEVDFISMTEMQFWKDLLAKYLYPIDDDKNERVSATFSIPFLFALILNFSFGITKLPCVLLF